MARTVAPYKFKLYGTNSMTATYQPSEANILACTAPVSITFDGELLTDDDTPKKAMGMDFTPQFEDENRKDINNILYSKRIARLGMNIKVLPSSLPLSSGYGAVPWQVFYFFKATNGTYANQGVLTKKYHFLHLYTGTTAVGYPLGHGNAAGSGTVLYLPVAFIDMPIRHDYETGLKYPELQFKLMRPEKD